MKQHKIGLGIALAVALGIAAPGLAQQAVQWRVEDGGNGHWYLRNTEKLQWSQARSWAMQRGGDLVSFETQAEFNWFRAAVSCGGEWLHVGGIQPLGSASPSSGWQWLTGVPFALPVSLGMDDSPCSVGCCGENGEQNFLHIAGNCDAFGDVNDGPFPGCAAIQSAYGSIVEWSADCSGDGVVDYGQVRAGYLSDGDGDNIPDCCEQGMSCEQIATGLEAHFSFDGNCLDSSGNGRHGVPVGIGFGAGPSLALGQSAYFDGITSEVQVQNVPIPTSNRFSWALWLKREEIGNIPVIERIQAIGNNFLSPSLFIRANGGLGFGSYSSTSGGSTVETNPVDVANGEWFHVACTSDGAGIRKVYVNATLLGEGPSADYGQPLPLILLGRDRLDCCPRLRGGIDDLRFYSRPLTAAEVAELYQLADACPADINQSGTIDAEDLAYVLFAWGMTGGKAGGADINGDATVDANDLALVLGSWGNCPQ